MEQSQMEKHRSPEEENDRLKGLVKDAFAYLNGMDGKIRDDAKFREILLKLDESR